MGKVQGYKTEKVVSFSCGGDKKSSPWGIPKPKGYEPYFKEQNITKFGEFMFGIRFAFEFLGYKAIPMDKGKYNDVYQRAIFKLIMENNINLQDYLNDRQIEFYDHEQDKKGRLIKVKARFISPLAHARTSARV
ncbi:MAG: hypothetical protein ACI4GX_04235 [Ruminococcus sp.]